MSFQIGAISENDPERPSRDHVGSLQRGLAVLEVLSARPAGMTMTEVASAAQLTRAGARRLLLTLEAAGYVELEGRTFRLTPRLLALARAWLQGSTLWSCAAAPMRALSARLQESCSVAVLSGRDIVYVARVPGRRIMSVALHVGVRLPAWCTSLGRVLLADLPAEERAAFLAGVEMERLTPRTIAEPAALAAEIERCRARGFSIVDEELELGLRSIAVPLRDHGGRVIAALNVSIPSSRFTPAQMEAEILPPLREAARQIEEYFVLE
ncbi:IclR family transcriptional regulator C-terminal domain-containing protein [Amaricoccus sp.]|uniref:IclR family transcriptional regulator domain-containing protein n=1 Tax=Amaricoccus sp. TaxID=1872485 RepID=UPI001B50A4F7|nr:IclR family transcriptional regulator C-terminal domain-containing protein [Amaricoccus sp.]MBP7003462.1 helix-turn-helix domain-containing protein [Amaricoccus sp.]